MQCNDSRLLIHAYLDNELDAGDSVQLLRHLQTCPSCAAGLKTHTRLKNLLRSAAPQHAMPDAIRKRVLAALLTAPATQPVAAPLFRQRFPARHWNALPIALAASFLLVAGGVLGVAMQRHASATMELTTDVLSNHLRSLQAQHLTDVLSSSQHTVKPWFDGKLDFTPLVPGLDADGFTLIGGRLDVLRGRRIVAIVYRRRLHAINLFEWPEAASDAAPISTDAGGGYHIVHWAQDGMSFWAASSLSHAEMETFAQAFRNAAAQPAAQAH